MLSHVARSVIVAVYEACRRLVELMESPEDYGAWRVFVESSEDAGEGRGVHALSKVMRLSMEAARNVLASAPLEIPLNKSRQEATEIAQRLREAGLAADARVVAHASANRCATHRHLANDGQCERCHAWICIACKAESGGKRLCPSCLERHARRGLFRHARVAVLLVVLVGVASWGWAKHRALQERNTWSRPLRIGVVILELEPIEDSTVAFLRGRIDRLAEVLDDEFARHAGRTMRPFEFEILGTTSISSLPPEGPPADGGLLENLEFTMALDDYLDAPTETLGLEEEIYDSIIWVVARDATKSSGARFVEGLAEVGGDRGIVVVDLEESTAALVAGVIGHELLHTLGATDKYDLNGPIFPHGYYTREPRFPQKRAEIMGREIPLNERRRRLPSFVGELGVGRKTALEIGWLRDGR